MKRNPDTLALVMDYAAAMEACAAYVAVKRPTIRDPESAYRLLRPVMSAATSGDSQETFFTLLLDTKNKVIGAPVECTRGLLDQCPVHPREVFREAVRQSAAVMVPARSVRREKRVDGAWDAPAVATAVSVGVRNMMSGVVILSILF